MQDKDTVEEMLDKLVYLGDIDREYIIQVVKDYCDGRVTPLYNDTITCIEESSGEYIFYVSKKELDKHPDAAEEHYRMLKMYEQPVRLNLDNAMNYFNKQKPGFLERVGKEYTCPICNKALLHQYTGSHKWHCNCCYSDMDIIQLYNAKHPERGMTGTLNDLAALYGVIIDENTPNRRKGERQEKR